MTDPNSNAKIVETNGSVTFSVRVVPRASKSEIIGEHDGALKIRLASPPVDGAANAELIKVLAKRFGVAKSSIEIVSGQASRLKQVRLAGITSAEVDAVLKPKA